MEARTPKIVFDEQLERLVKWFRPRLAVEQGDMIAYKLRSYPVEALKFAVDRCIEEKRPTPSQFPTIKELRALMEEWRNNPATGAGTANTMAVEDCSDCNSKGFLWFKREVFDFGPLAVDRNGVATAWPVYEFVCKCGSCRNSRAAGLLPNLKRFTRAELIEQGREVFPYSL
jgi:hypothetical protein